MLSIVNYITSLFFTGISEDQTIPVAPPYFKENNDNFDFVFLISKNDLTNVKLKPVSNRKKINADELLKVKLKPVKKEKRKKPFNLNSLTKDQLKKILNVKLKKVKVSRKPVVFEPSHPVLRELLNKTNKII